MLVGNEPSHKGPRLIVGQSIALLVEYAVLLNSGIEVMSWLVDLQLFLVITYDHVKVLGLHDLIGSGRSKIPAHQLPPIRFKPLDHNLLVLKPSALYPLLY